MFPLPRVIYAMASDGLLFQFLGTINERFKTPVAGTLLSGLFAGESLTKIKWKVISIAEIMIESLMSIQVGQGNLTRSEYFGQGRDFLSPHELTHGGFFFFHYNFLKNGK